MTNKIMDWLLFDATLFSFSMICVILFVLHLLERNDERNDERNEERNQNNITLETLQFNRQIRIYV
jgi:hypothetical protein